MQEHWIWFEFRLHTIMVPNLNFSKIAKHFQKSKKSSDPSRKSPIFSSKFIFLVSVSSLAYLLSYAPTHKVRKFLFFFFFFFLERFGKIWDRNSKLYLILQQWHYTEPFLKQLHMLPRFLSIPQKDCSFFSLNLFYDFIFFEVSFGKEVKKES